MLTFSKLGKCESNLGVIKTAIALDIMYNTFFCLGKEETTSTTSKTDNERTTTTMAIAPVKKKDDGWWNYLFGSSEGIQTY